MTARCSGNCVSGRCTATAMYAIDSKGYVYCKAHHFRGRRMTQTELVRINGGQPLERY